MGARGQRLKPKMPKKGTKRRAILLALLRESGASPNELIEKGLCNCHASISATADHFADRLEFDIRTFTNQHKERGIVYKIVGRWLDDGRYVDYVARKIKGPGV